MHHGGSLRPVTETSAKQYSRVKTSRGINVSCTDSGVMYTQIERKGCLKNQGLYGGLAGRSTKENTNKWMRASNYELDSIQVLHIGQLVTYQYDKLDYKTNQYYISIPQCR